jgi:hypothetical protein
MKKGLAGFLKVLIWEYVQNLPILAGFFWALVSWQADRFWVAILYMLAGGTGSAVLIYLTESRKQSGYQEPKSVLLMNLVGMTILVFAIVLYFSARWSTWMTDLVIGVLCGAGLGILQSLAARKKINVVHAIALGIASPLILAFIRWMSDASRPIWASALLTCLLATLVIGLIDYAPDEFQPDPAD